jgi:uncharacterized membrane protein YdjX (TVP38/TMEM64 family)
MKAKNYIKLALLFVFVAVAVWIVYKYNLIHRFNFLAVRKFVSSYGEFSALAFILIFSIRTVFLILPYSLMVIIGGSIFGPFYGFVYSMVSVAISASIAFYFSKLLGREAVEKLLHKGKLRDIGSKIEKNGMKMIFLMRISSVFPFDILGFAAGLTNIRFRDFLLGTVLGMLAETFVFSYLGDNIHRPLSPKFIVAIVLIIVILGASYLYKKVYMDKNKKLP